MARVKLFSDGTTAGTRAMLIDDDGGQHEIPAESVAFECEREGLCYAVLTLADVSADIEANTL